MLKKWFKISFLVALPCFFVWAVIRIGAAVSFDKHCGEYLLRSYQASTVEIAAAELNTAIVYVENEGLTSGYTSAVYDSPSEDLAHWHKNLKLAHETLERVKNDPFSNSAEQASVLHQLTNNKVYNHPEGISVYGYNTLLFWLGLISGLVILVAGFGWLLTYDDYYD